MAKQFLLVNNSRVYSVKANFDVDATIKTLRDKGRDVQKIKAPPSVKTMERWMCDGVARATDGCRVEPDGNCVHGHRSWLLIMGVI